MEYAERGSLIELIKSDEYQSSPFDKAREAHVRAAGAPGATYAPEAVASSERRGNPRCSLRIRLGQAETAVADAAA